MIVKRYTIFLMGLFLVGMLSSNVIAITASLGNVRAIVEVEMKESPTIIERTIQVNNVNDEEVKIKLEPTGELKDLVTIIDKEFTLKPDESKKARYSVAIKEPGNSEFRIIATFTPEKGQAIGLSSVLIVRAFSEGNLPKNNNVKEDNGNTDVNEENDTNNGFNFNPTKVPDKNIDKNTDDNKITGSQTTKLDLEMNGFTILFIILIIIIALLGGFYYLKRT